MSLQRSSAAAYREHDRVVRSVTIVTGAVALAATLLLSVLILPALAEILTALPEQALLGLLAVLSTATRFLAGVFGARRLRGQFGTVGRGDALPSVLVGTAAAWLLFALLVLVASQGGSGQESWWRILLELPRWLAEAGVGALLVSPGPAEAADPSLRRYTRPSRAQVRGAVGARDQGAASLEYAGFLFVIVVVIGSLVTSATPVGQAIALKICEAVGASCGGPSAEARADQLGIKCVLSKRDRDLGYNVVYDFVRVQRKDTDGITRYGDGSAQVTLSQGVGVGVDGGGGAKVKSFQAPVGWKANATVNGDLGYVYKFPAEYGGMDAASDFLEGRRNGWQQAGQIVTPGAQTVLEGATRFRDWASAGISDLFSDPSSEELLQREVDHRAGTADAIEVAVSIQGEAGAWFGDGVTAKDPAGNSVTQKKGFEVGAKVKLEIKGKTTVGLDPGHPDSTGSSFTGSVKVDGEASAAVNIASFELPPFLSFKGGAGAAGSYTVSFNEKGKPTKLVITGDTKLSGGLGVQKPRSVGLPADLKGKVGTNAAAVSEWQYTLDLDTSTPQGKLNRDAFDQAFTVVSQDVEGHTAAVVVPAFTTLPEAAARWGGLADRISQDGFLVQSDYAEERNEGSLGAKVSGFGAEGSKNSATRTLLGASAFDNRNGGAEFALATCKAG